MLLSTTPQLNEFASRAARAGSVALDTEFVWTKTFYPRLGIIQATLPDGECGIIDGVALSDFSPLARLLADPGVTKILHDAPQDLTIIRRATGVYPVNLFDTRCAAGFVGLGSTISLVDLLDALLGVKMTKTERRTDWCRRPLTADQMAYAMEDVRYMHQCRDVLLSRAAALNRKQWVLEEQRKYDNPAQYDDPDPQQQFLRVKGVGDLSPRKLVIARELTAWRELEARRIDHPRSHVITDEALVSICRVMPATVDMLRTCRGIRREDVSYYSRVILDLVRAGIETDSSGRPPSMRHKKSNNIYKVSTDALMAWIRTRCEGTGVDWQLVAATAEVSLLVRKGPSADPAEHRLLNGWRRSFLGDELLSVITGRSKVHIDAYSGRGVIEEKRG